MTTLPRKQYPSKLERRVSEFRKPSADSQSFMQELQQLRSQKVTSHSEINLTQKIRQFVLSLLLDGQDFQSVKAHFNRAPPNPAQGDLLKPKLACHSHKTSFASMQQTASFKRTSQTSSLEGEKSAMKRLSIVVPQFTSCQLDGIVSSESLMSQSALRTLSSISVPEKPLNAGFVLAVFDTPTPFLSTLSLCLLVRYCLKSEKKIEMNCGSWLLCLSTILAYKIYEEEPLEGMFNYYKDLLGITKQDLLDLQRCFLEVIDYDTSVRNYDFHFVLSRLIDSPSN